MGKRILVLGSQGMLGQTVCRYLSQRDCHVTATQFADSRMPGYLDARAGPESWRPLIADCEYAINCIGILKRGICPGDAQSLRNAIRVNALFPHEMARVAAESGMRIIHMSTDAVFAGGRAESYRECDTPDCTDVYGRTKVLGECPAPNVLNLRCSIVGRDGLKHKGLLEWLLQQEDVVNGFQDQLWNGVTTVQFAQLCEAIIEANAFEAIRRVAAVHHFCPNPATTKYDLLRAWAKAAGKSVRIRPAESHDPSSNRLLGTDYTCLGALYRGLADWPEILSELTS